MRKQVLTSLLPREGHQVFFVRMFFGLFLQVGQQVVSLKRSRRSFLCLVLLPHPSWQQRILDEDENLHNLKDWHWVLEKKSFIFFF